MYNSERIVLEKIRNTERFKVDDAFLQDACEDSCDKVYSIMQEFVHMYPSASSENLYYKKFANGYDWVEGFWTGMLWLAYDITKNEIFRAVAEAQFDDYEKRLNDFEVLSHHDIGFLYSPSIVAQYKITKADKAKKLALRAADLLAKRYSPGAKIIQVRDQDPQGQFIVDCCMNLPLLFWASSVTGDRNYYTKALNHMYQVANYIIRDDASTIQGFKIDEITGEAIGGYQGQGYNEQSCWARGQAWVIYGLAIAYQYTKEIEFIKLAKRVANYCLNRLPSDLIAGWDLIFTDDDAERDSSAASIIACGLLELSDILADEDEEKEIYYDAAKSITFNLYKYYRTDKRKSNGLLLHGVYVKKNRENKEGIGIGDDECCIWGDYFYLEALARIAGHWRKYW